MKILECCASYFNGFNEIANYKHNDNKTNALAVLKICSYLSLIIPFAFLALYGAASLYGRVTKKENLSPQDINVNNQVNKIIFNNDPVMQPSPVVNEPVIPLKVGLSDVLSAYDTHFVPKMNRNNLEEYGKSEDYQRHAKTARIYYNSGQLSEDDALKIVYQREPTNIAMGSDQYNKEMLNKLFGYEQGVFNDANAKKADGTSFKDLPNTAAVYSETYLWDPPGGINKKEIACLSLPAPALDSPNQPHYEYYMETGQLDAQKYDDEMGFLFRIIEKVIRDNKNKAFDGKGINRVVLCKFGMVSFLEALSPEDRKIAQEAFKDQLSFFLFRILDLNMDVVMSEYSMPTPKNTWHDKMIFGDIIKSAQENDLVINAWNPHSAPGNGNDFDKSFDGAMGKGSGILLTQTGWLNENLKSKKSLVAVS